MNLVKDREFIQLMKAGRPGISIPTPMTVGRDIKISFEKCHEQIDKILRVSFTLPRMLGPPQIIVCLWHGRFICIMRVICWHFFWIS